MAHNFLTKAQLGNFYNGRKKLDQAITQIFGSDIHLHDISQSSERSSSNSHQHTTEELINILTNNNNNPENKSNLVNLPIVTSPTSITQQIKPKLDKFQNNFYQNRASEQKYDKLFKQHTQLKKKQSLLTTQSQTNKHKSQLWQKLKQFLQTTFDKQYKLKSIRYSTTADSVILEQFLTVLEEIIKNNRNGKLVQQTLNSQNMRYRELYQQMKKRYAEECKKSMKIMLELQVYKNQNINLKEKDNVINNQRISRINQLSIDIQEKFNQYQENLKEKVQENKYLQERVSKLESQIVELRGMLRKKEKTISTNPETLAELYRDPYKDKQVQTQLYTKLSKQKDTQITNLKTQNTTLLKKFLSLQHNSQKMKKVIKLAQTLNNQFIEKLQQSIIKKNQTFNHQEVSLQYQIGDKRSLIQQDFHLTNQRFRIVKSRSLGKERERYTYGQAKK